MNLDPFSAVVNDLAKLRKAKRANTPDLVGRRFGQWTVQTYTPSRTLAGKQVKAHCTCCCDCGSVREVLFDSLRRGKSKSCGHDTYGRPPA